jgi:ADP-heptose:LPS heptosyltransferase
LANTSPTEDARELLRSLERGQGAPGPLLERLLKPEATPALFRYVVEPLSDAFLSPYSHLYAALFAEVIARTSGPQARADAAGLVARYQRVRQVRQCTVAPVEHVVVLSRVTLGADVAVSSVVLDGARRRFPEAKVHFAGPRKAWELFGGRGDVRLIEVPYRRGGTLAERLNVVPALREAIAALPNAIVIDPDSRITQLGLLPVMDDEERYFFFDSRTYQSGEDASLGGLTRHWVEAVFGVPNARAWIAPARDAIPGDRRRIALSLGVGGNPQKRVGDEMFERSLVEALAGTGRPLLADRGGDDEEAARAERAIAGVAAAQTWQGDFATFAASIGASALYVGYDSAGQHVAAACGVPLICVFSGAPSDLFFDRWCPARGPGAEVIRVERQSPETVLKEVRSALQRLLP